jgi:hypothetical protein
VGSWGRQLLLIAVPTFCFLQFLSLAEQHIQVQLI